MSDIDGNAGTPARTRARFFYGWYIVGVGYLSQLANSTTLSSTLGVFLKPLSEEFGWQRSYISGMRSFENLACGLMIFLLGPMLDRRGTRWAMVTGGVFLGFGLVFIGQINDAMQFLLARGVVIIVGATLISSTVNSIAISNWFKKKRGRAMGISGAGIATGKIFLAPLITTVMGIWGWREAWVLMGVMVLVLVPLPAAIFLRRQPEDLGLLPDGDSSGKEAEDAPGVSNTEELLWTRREALRLPAFWLVILTFGIASIGATGLALHTIPYLTDIGFSPVLAASALSVLAVFQLTGNIGWGFIAERVPVRKAGTLMFIWQATGVTTILLFHSPAIVFIGLAALGFSISGAITLQDVVWADYFGRRSVGAIRSLGTPLLVLFSSGGPLYFGYLYDVTGGYQLSLVGFAAISLIAAGLVLACRPPKK